MSAIPQNQWSDFMRISKTAAEPKTTRRAYGWVPDHPDHRDLMYSAPTHVAAALPASVDLRPQCPGVFDQGQLGSCTGNAIAGAHEFDQIKQQLPSVFTPSRLFIYYNERAMERTIASDAGAQIRDGIKSLGRQGVCPERMWPYAINRFADRPSAQCYLAARKHCAVQYYRVPRLLSQFKGCLAEGFPFVFGFTVYSAFEGDEVAKTGVLQMPGPGEQVVGGHAVLAVGYDDMQQRFIVRNSWGSAWGMQGYFTMPYAYLLDENLSDDFWTVRLIR
jgi:C1A family cysteine protease